MSAYGYSYEPAAAASGYLGNTRGPSAFGNPVGGSYAMSAYGGPYGSSSQPGSIQGLSASVASGVSPVSHHPHGMQTPTSGYTSGPPPLGSATAGFHSFSSPYGPTGHSSYGGLMNQYQSCPSLGDAVLHQGKRFLNAGKRRQSNRRRCHQTIGFAS